MKKSLYFLSCALMLLLAVPQANAIITDPDDYIIYDTGAFADSSSHEKFVLPDFMTFSPGVAFKAELNNVGRSFTEDFLEDYGFEPGTTLDEAKGKKIGALVINQRKNTDETANGERFVVPYIDYMQMSEEEAALPWNYDNAGNQFQRPSDSITIRVPKTCDSIYIQALGTNSYYGLMVYEVGDSEFLLPEGGRLGKNVHGKPGVWRTNLHYTGGNWGAVQALGFKPKHVGPGDSTTIVILGPAKDSFADNSKNNKTHFCKDNNAVKFTHIYTGETVTDEDGTVRDRYVTCERWGQWEGTSINRIKVFGKIETGEVPVFDGTHSGFTFSYQTRNSGTVLLDKPLNKANGWNSTPFVRYASDEGVMRSVLSATSYIYLGYDEAFGTFATKLNLVEATPATVSYDTVDHHVNYFQITVPTTGFQDLTMEFDYAVRGGNNPVIVAAYIKGDKACAVLDTLDNSVNPATQMAHASIAIPDSFANQKNFIVRLMVGKGGKANEFDLANLKFKGYKDFYPSAEGAAKVAYLTPAADRIHVLGLSSTADSADVILPYLQKDENVTVSVIAKDVWGQLATASAEDIVAAFEDYNVVVASPYMTAADLDFAKALIGKKAFLNFNAEAFLNWNTNAASSADAADTAMVYAEEYFFHPIFSGLDLKKESNVVPDFFGVVGANVTAPAADGAYLLATGISSGAVSLYEDYTNPKAKYIFMDMSAENSNAINSKGKQVLLNAISYLKNGGNFAKPTFELLSTGAIVENSAQFAMAANYDYGVLNLKEPVIKMKSSTDAGGVYTIGEGFGFGGNNITFEPNSGDDKVIISGLLSDADKLNATHLIFRSITFKPLAGQNGIIALKKNEQVRDELRFEKCTFDGLRGGLVALAGDSITVKAITLNNCLFEGVEAPALIGLEGAGILCQTVSVKENRFYEYAVPTLLDWKTVTTDKNGTLTVAIDNNTFRNKTAVSARQTLISIKEDQNFEKAAINVNNNILYNVGNLNVDLFAAPVQRIYTSEETLKDVNGNDSIAVKNDTIAFTATLDLNKNFLEGATLALNVAEGGAAEWDTTCFESVNKESLGITKVFEDEELTQILKTSEMYVGGTESGLNRAYLGAFANYLSRQAGEETVFTVKNARDLKTAIELAIAGDIIELENNMEDSLGVYQMGSSGFTYPSTGGKLVIRAAEGHTPVLFGNLAPANASLNLDTLCIDGLTWSDVTVWDSTRISGYNNESYAPFYFSGTNGYLGLLHITNSAFKNLEKQQVLRANKCYNEGGKTGLTIGKIVMDYNEFDNHGGATEDGKTGGHFIQFDVKGAYTISNFTFVENVVKNFHGSQMFNINREGALNPADSTMNIVISNNIFYKVGGNSADQYRNFLEFSKNPEGFEVNISITNNIFWKRWSENNHPLGQLALFDGSKVKSYKIDVLKNYYEGEYYTGEETFGANPMAPKEDASSRDRNLALSASSAVEVNRDAALDWESFADYIELDESTEDFTANISQEYEVFTAGEAHPYNAGYRYIGTAAGYGLEPIRDESGEVSIEKVEGIGFTAFASGGELYINLAEKAEVIICHVSGKRVSGQTLNAGLNELSGLNNGMYIVNVNGHNAKVLVK